MLWLQPSFLSLAPTYISRLIPVHSPSLAPSLQPETVPHLFVLLYFYFCSSFLQWCSPLFSSWWTRILHFNGFCHLCSDWPLGRSLLAFWMPTKPYSQVCYSPYWPVAVFLTCHFLFRGRSHPGTPSRGSTVSGSIMETQEAHVGVGKAKGRKCGMWNMS